MKDLIERVVGGANMHVAPTITGLVDVLDRQVREHPEGPALVLTRDRIPVSYGALAALVDDVAARLRSTGLRRGDAVGLISANNAEFVVALLGAARAGLVIAPLDPALPQSEMAARLERLGAQGILVGPRAGRLRATGAVPHCDMGSAGSRRRRRDRDGHPRNGRGSRATRQGCGRRSLR